MNFRTNFRPNYRPQQPIIWKHILENELLSEEEPPSEADSGRIDIISINFEGKSLLWKQFSEISKNDHKLIKNAVRLGRFNEFLWRQKMRNPTNDWSFSFTFSFNQSIWLEKIISKLNNQIIPFRGSVKQQGTQLFQLLIINKKLRKSERKKA